MNRTVRAAGIAACLGLSLILVGSVLGTGSPRDAALPAPIPADADPTTPGANGQTKPVGVTTSKPPAGSIPANQAIAELRGKGAPSLVIDSSGAIKAVTAATGKTLAPQRDAFATRYAAGFGAGEATKLKAATSAALPGGDNVTHYQQTVAGLPVMGGELVVTTNARGGVRSAISALSGYSPKATNAKISSDAARSIAIKAIGERYAITPDLIADASVKLWLADQSKLGGTAGLRPTYWVQFSGANGLELGDVLIDALDGSVKLAATEHQTAQRRVCDQGNVKVDLRYLTNYACTTGSAFNAKTTTRVENGPASSVAQVNAAYDRLGETYNYYKSTFGLNSFDGHGAELRATVRACDIGYTCPYANAFWDGSQFAFGDGWVVDDVVAHEFTHAVTEHSSGLFYWYESGAINEAFSDIMGQFMDLRTPGDDTGTDSSGHSKRWLMGEALSGPSQFGAIRSMENPNLFGDPASYLDSRWFADSPGNEQDNGGVHYNSGVANKLAYLIADGGNFGGYSVSGLGLTKSEQLWYRVMHLLSSGADYRELRLAMTTACQEFIGHIGFTPADCAQVQNAINAVQLPTAGNDRTQETAFCPGSVYEAPIDLFFDDFEHGVSQWKASDTKNWQLIPSTVVPYTYATSGKGSINGWTYNKTANNGTGTSFEMVDPVVLPAGKNAAMRFSSAATTQAGDIAMSFQVNGSWQSVGEVGVESGGYGARTVNLSMFAGTSVKVRFTIVSSGALLDWYMDDFRIYNCDGRPSVPTNPIAYPNGTTIKASWGLPQFVGTGPSSWDVAVSPSVDPSQLVRSSNGGSETLDITGADPNLTYTITIRYVSNGKLGEPVKLVVAPNAPVSCQSKLQLTPYTLVKRRPAPGTSEPCLPPRVIPRRS